jgi:hypothetical protein
LEIAHHRPRKKDNGMIIFRKLNLKKIIKERKNTDGSAPVSVRDVKGAGCGGTGM